MPLPPQRTLQQQHAESKIDSLLAIPPLDYLSPCRREAASAPASHTLVT